MNTAAMAGILGASTLAGLYTKKNPGDDSLEKFQEEKEWILKALEQKLLKHSKIQAGKNIRRN
jgi:hypothetical protein